MLLLEYFENATYAAYNFNEPWDGPNNRKLESRMPRCYSCPVVRGRQAPWTTNYFVVVGDQTLFPGPKPLALTDVEKPTSTVVMLVESVGQNVHWMEPKDLAFDSMSFVVNDESRPSVSSRHPDSRPYICMADVTRSRLSDVSPEMLKEMFLIKRSGKGE